MKVGKESRYGSGRSLAVVIWDLLGFGDLGAVMRAREFTVSVKRQ
jgi:hypothetical protein